MNDRLQHDVSAPIDLARRQMVGAVRSSYPAYADLLLPYQINMYSRGLQREKAEGVLRRVDKAAVNRS